MPDRSVDFLCGREQHGQVEVGFGVLLVTEQDGLLQGLPGRLGLALLFELDAQCQVGVGVIGNDFHQVAIPLQHLGIASHLVAEHVVVPPLRRSQGGQQERGPFQGVDRSLGERSGFRGLRGITDAQSGSGFLFANLPDEPVEIEVQQGRGPDE